VPLQTLDTTPFGKPSEAKDIANLLGKSDPHTLRAGLKFCPFEILGRRLGSGFAEY